MVSSKLIANALLLLTLITTIAVTGHAQTATIENLRTSGDLTFTSGQGFFIAGSFATKPSGLGMATYTIRHGSSPCRLRRPGTIYAFDAGPVTWKYQVFVNGVLANDRTVTLDGDPGGTSLRQFATGFGEDYPLPPGDVSVMEIISYEYGTPVSANATTRWEGAGIEVYCDSGCFSTPAAGTITASPSSASPGATVAVTGSNWATGMGSQYRLLFAGMPMATQLVGCDMQPNLSFDVPCDIAAGTYPLVVQLLDGNQQILAASQSLQFKVAISAIAPQATACVSAPSVKFQYSDGRSIGNLLRIGLPSLLDDRVTRTLSLRAVVQPSSLASELTVESSDPLRLEISRVRRSSNNLFFSADGIEESTSKGDVSILVKSKAGDLIAILPVSVVVPKFIAKPHDVQGIAGKTVVENLVLNEDTNPGVLGVPKGFGILNTVYYRRLVLKVLDQFSEPIGDIYAGAEVREIIEDISPNPIPIHQRLSTASTYTDPVGYGIGPSGQSFHLADAVPLHSKEAKNWPKANKVPIPSEEVGSEITVDLDVDVDGYLLVEAVRNRIVVIGEEGITIIWD